MEVPQKTKNRPLYVPALPLWGIYPKEYKPTYKKDTCTPMFIVALSTTAEIWNQLRYPTTNE
jgi:hypothetical protein